MDEFQFRKAQIEEYGSYVRSFQNIQDDRNRTKVEKQIKEGLLWPEPLIRLNPAFEPVETFDELVELDVSTARPSSIRRPPVPTSLTQRGR